MRGRRSGRGEEKEEARCASSEQEDEARAEGWRGWGRRERGVGGVPGVLAWAKLLVPAGAGRPSELEFCAAASGKAAFHGSTMPRHLGLRSTLSLLAFQRVVPAGCSDMLLLHIGNMTLLILCSTHFFLNVAGRALLNNRRMTRECIFLFGA